MRLLALLTLFASVSCKRSRATPEPITTIPRVMVGGACSSTEACQVGLICDHEGTCAVDGALGTAVEGETCDATVACAIGLVCNGANTCANPGSPGTAAFGESCDVATDCQGGLSCYEDLCLGFDVPLLDRPFCPLAETDDVEPYRVLHDRDNLGNDDVFQEPFPSDARSIAGPPLLDLFPTFGDLPVFGDVAAGIVEDYQVAFDGYGANAPIFLRISRIPDTSTVRVGLPLPIVGDPADPANDGRGNVGVVDLTEGPSFGTLAAASWTLRTHQPYHCDPWMAFVPVAGEPLRPGHTYGVFVTDGLLGPDGEVLDREPTFEALIAAERPSGDLGEAWDSYAPMRGYLDANGLDRGSLRGGTVFTVADHRAAGEAVRSAAATAAPPVASALVACGELPGPHADVDDPARGCFGTASAYHEIQGTLSVPHVQLGSPPFAVRADGGEADWELGSPEIVESRDVTFAMTVPRGTPPANGWPVLLFAPDAGEDYRSFIVEGLAERWSAVTSDSGQVGFAIMSIDTWLTGPRAGTIDPAWAAAFPAAHEEALLYDNPLNPLAARDNLTQSAIDWHTAMRWLADVDWSTSSPAGTPLPLDTDRVWMVGQGIGGRAVPLVAAYEPRIQGVVLAATAGMWSETLRGRTEPVSPGSLLGPALGDPKLDRLQPVVALAQQIVDRTEAVDHGRFLHFEAMADRDVLLLVSDDPYTGRAAMDAMARSAFVQQVVQDGAEPIERVVTTSGEVSANVAGSTAVALVNLAADPHRLLYDNPRSVVQVDGFLGSAVQDGRATVPFIP